MIEVKDVVKAFGGVRAIDGATFSVNPGKITALIGPNGAGKTTLFNAICGLIHVDSGKITFKGQEIHELKSYQIARLGISRTFQMTRLFKNLSIKDNLSLANPSMSDEDFIKHLKRVYVEKDLSMAASSLSYGQQRLVELARALLLPHELLMLDEPTAGVNPLVRKELKNILRTAKKEGKTILLIEHDMDFVMDVSDEVIVLAEGKVLAKGKPSVVRRNKKVLEAYLGK